MATLSIPFKDFISDKQSTHEEFKIKLNSFPTCGHLYRQPAVSTRPNIYSVVNNQKLESAIHKINIKINKPLALGLRQDEQAEYNTMPIAKTATFSALSNSTP